MTARRVLLAPSIERGEDIKRADPALADVLVVSPLCRLEGLHVSDILVADGFDAYNADRLDRALAVLRHQQAKARRLSLVQPA